MPRFHKKCRIHFHSKRYVLPDSDGVSPKAAIDGLVLAGILANDTTKEVYPPTFSFEKISVPEPETTTITVEEV